MAWRFNTLRIRRALRRVLSWVTELGATIVSPFERGFSAAARKVVAIAEGVEGIESLFIRIGWALFWPMRMFWWLIQGMASALIPDSVRSVLEAPFHIMARLGRGCGK